MAAESKTSDKIAVMLDPIADTVSQGIKWGAKVIVTHHPLYMQPKAPKRLDTYHRILGMVLKADAWLYAAHTCMDASAPADWFGNELGLGKMEFLERQSENAAMSVEFWPKAPLAKERLEFLADTEGFINMSQDHSGRVRLICEPGTWPSIQNSGIFAQDEEFFITKFSEPNTHFGIGRIGDLDREMDFDEFLAKLGGIVSTKNWTLCGPEKKTVSRVAYCTGSGGSLVDEAFGLGADVYVTGDVKYHTALEAPGPIIDVGHFCLEEEMMRRFADILAGLCPDAQVRFFPGKDPYSYINA